ncbi:hypothetical protein O983_19405 [Mycobacterium avium 09-5983]|nr:hypothetical protein O983_19405 [Mycobacterium avium 09-5983]
MAVLAGPVAQAVQGVVCGHRSEPLILRSFVIHGGSRFDRKACDGACAGFNNTAEAAAARDGQIRARMQRQCGHLAIRGYRVVADEYRCVTGILDDQEAMLIPIACRPDLVGVVPIVTVINVLRSMD